MSSRRPAFLPAAATRPGAKTKTSRGKSAVVEDEKNQTPKRQTKTSRPKASKYATTEAAESRAQVAAARKVGKRRARKAAAERGESTETDPALVQLQADLSFRHAIRQRIYAFIHEFQTSTERIRKDAENPKSEFMTVHKYPRDDARFQEARALLTQHLDFEQPFSPAELDALSVNPFTSQATWPRLVRVRGKGATAEAQYVDTPLDLVAILRTYNQLLAKLPYAALRSQVLQALHLWSEQRHEATPNFVLDYLHRDQLFQEGDLKTLSLDLGVPASILSLIKRYNETMLSGPHLPLEPETQVTATSHLDFTDVQEQARISLKDLRKKASLAHKVEEKATMKASKYETKEAEDVELGKKPKMKAAEPAVPTDVMVGLLLRHVAEYRQAVRSELANAIDEDFTDTRATELAAELEQAKQTGDEKKQAELEPILLAMATKEKTEGKTSDISDEAVDRFMATSSNLPYWTLLNELAAEPTKLTNLDSVLSHYPEIIEQFKHLFRRLRPAQRLEFVLYVFALYPNAEFPNGPTKPILSLLVEFYNDLVRFPDESIDDDLTVQIGQVPAGQFLTLFKSLTRAQALAQRLAVFGRFPSISAEDRDAILDYYKASLILPNTALLYDPIDEQVLLVIGSTTKTTSFQGVSKSKTVESTTPIRPLLITDLVVPWTQGDQKLQDTTRQEITRFLTTHLPDLVPYWDVRGPVDDTKVRTIIVPDPSGSRSLMVLVMERLGQHFDAQLPPSSDFIDFVTHTTAQIVNQVLASPDASSSQLLDLPTHLPAHQADKFKNELEKARDASRTTWTFESLRQEAARLGLDMSSGLELAAGKLFSKLKHERDEGILSKKKYERRVRSITEYMNVYREAIRDLKAKDAVAEDTDLKMKRRLVRRAYEQILTSMQSYSTGLTDDELARDAWKEVMDLQPPIATAEEIELIRTTKGDMRRSRRARTQDLEKKRAAFAEVVKDLPGALKKQLADLMTEVERDLERVKEGRRREAGAIYQFLATLTLSVASQKFPAGGRFKKPEDVVAEYAVAEYSEVLPPALIQHMVELAQRPGTTLRDLIHHASLFTQETKMLKNPLVRETQRRDSRYERVFEQLAIIGGDDLAQLRRQLPAPLSLRMRECVAAHRLKPWLDLPQIGRYQLLVANPAGKRRDQLGAEERTLLNAPMASEVVTEGKHYLGKTVQREFVLRMPDGAKLYFYRPTNLYWLTHCAQAHPETCSGTELAESFTLGSSKAKFYELLYRPPTNPTERAQLAASLMPQVRKTEHGSEWTVTYGGDSNFLVLLANDPKYYQAECDWFAARYTPAEQATDALAQQALSSRNDDSTRRFGRSQIRPLLALARTKYGIAALRGSIDDASAVDALEQAIVNRYQPKTVRAYFEALDNVLVILDVTSPLGKAAQFTSYTLAACSEAYYPVFLGQLSSWTDLLPEIFLLASSDAHNELKRKTRDYLKAKVENMADQQLLALVSPELAESVDQSIGQVLSEWSQNLDAALPKLSGLTLRNLCSNGEEFKGMDDKWLTYYVYEGKVLCLSKLKLAEMALAKQYKYEGVKLDPAFVDGFASYAQFSAQEMREAQTYARDAIESLFAAPDNQPLLERLAHIRTDSLFGQLTADDLTAVGLWDQIKSIKTSDSHRINMVVQEVDIVVDNYITQEVLTAARVFIRKNLGQLRSMMTERWTRFRLEFPLAPADQYNALQGGLVNPKAYEALVLDPAVEVVIKHTETTTQWPIHPNVKRLIRSILVEDTGPSPSVAGKADELSCEACRAHLSQTSFRTAIQYREGLTTHTKLVSFCSSQCLGKYKVKEPSSDDAELARLQEAINTVTRSYLDYAEMVRWARSPSSFAIPSKPELDQFVRDLARVRGVDEAQMRALLPTLSADENALGISTTDPQGRSISQAELWDRIRIHPLFVPGISELLTLDKYEALVELADKKNGFNVPMYSTEWDEAVEFYETEPESLRNVWKQLRANPAFVRLLYSTVTTFNPYEVAPAAESKDPEAEARRLAREREMSRFDTKMWTAMTTWLEDGLRKTLTMPAEKVLDDMKTFRALREDLIKRIQKKVPSLPLTFDKQRFFQLLNLRDALKVWFNNHWTAVQTRAPLTVEFAADRSRHLISSTEMLRLLRQLCDKPLKILSADSGEAHQAFSRWTFQLLQSKAEERRFKWQTFYRLVINTFGCKRLEQSEQEYGEFLFSLEKVNQVIDEALSRLMEEQAQETAGASYQGKFTGLTWGKAKVQLRKLAETKSRVEMTTRGRKLKPAEARFLREVQTEETKLKDELKAAGLLVVRDESELATDLTEPEDADVTLGQLSIIQDPTAGVSVPTIKTRLVFLAEIKARREELKKQLREERKSKATERATHKTSRAMIKRKPGRHIRGEVRAQSVVMPSVSVPAMTEEEKNQAVMDAYIELTEGPWMKQHAGASEQEILQHAQELALSRAGSSHSMGAILEDIGEDRQETREYEQEWERPGVKVDEVDEDAEPENQDYGEEY